MSENKMPRCPDCGTSARHDGRCPEPPPYPDPYIVRVLLARRDKDAEIARLRRVIAEAIEDANDAVDAVVNASPWQNGAAAQGAATIAILEKAARS